MIILPDNALELLTFKGFFKAYEVAWFSGLTQRKAYDKIEGLYLTYFNLRKYSSFESFQSVIHSKK